jgi:hypothetical protein
VRSDLVESNSQVSEEWSRIRRYNTCSTVMSTFESLGTASAQLATLLERGEYDRLAQLLDSFELQVRQWLMLLAASWARHLCRVLLTSALQAEGPVRCCGFADDARLFRYEKRLCPQVATPQLPQGWPHAIHLLGHLYNFNLCESTSQSQHAAGPCSWINSMPAHKRVDWCTWCIKAVSSHAERMHASCGSAPLQLSSRWISTLCTLVLR